MKSKKSFVMNRKKAMGLFFGLLGLLTLAAACFLIGCASAPAADSGPWQEGRGAGTMM
jgi:hypothetical protein